MEFGVPFTNHCLVCYALLLSSSNDRPVACSKLQTHAGLVLLPSSEYRMTSSTFKGQCFPDLHETVLILCILQELRSYYHQSLQTQSPAHLRLQPYTWILGFSSVSGPQSPLLFLSLFILFLLAIYILLLCIWSGGDALCF